MVKKKIKNHFLKFRRFKRVKLIVFHVQQVDALYLWEENRNGWLKEVGLFNYYSSKILGKGDKNNHGERGMGLWREGGEDIDVIAFWLCFDCYTLSMSLIWKLSEWNGFKILNALETGQ